MLAQAPKLTINYFLWTEDGPFRFPERLHRNLIAGRIALPQFKNTSQKLVEVVMPTGEILQATARGIIYTFDENGFLDLSALRQVMPTTPRFMGEGGVKDLSPTIEKRRFRAKHTWTPDAVILDQIRAGLDYGGALAANKIPLFKIAKTA